MNLGNFCDVNNNIANNNANDGIHAPQNNNIIYNTANENSGDGIEAGQESSVINNIANDNDGDGIEVGCPSNLVGNTMQGNGVNLSQNGVGCKRYNNLF